MPPKYSSESEDNSDIADSSDHFQVVPSNGEESSDQLETDLASLLEVEEVETEEELQKTAPIVTFIMKALKFMLMPIFKIIFAPTAQRAVVKTAIMGVTISWILMTSIVAYIMFYNYYVPPIAHVKPIWFQYASPREITQQTVPGPHALIDLSKPGMTTMPLRHEQIYDVSIQLNVPTSNINFDIGNFMIDLKLQLDNETTIVESSRPTILRYQSQMQRIMRVFTNALPLLVGVADESQKLRITLIESYMASKLQPISKVAVSVSDPKIQIYDAKLLIIASFRGLRYYMYYRYVFTGFIFVTSFAIIELIFAAATWKLFGEGLWHKIQMIANASEEEVGGEVEEEEGGEGGIVDSESSDTPPLPNYDSSEKELD